MRLARAGAWVSLLWLASCTPDIGRDPAPEQVVALFDPGAEIPVLPTPTDLAKDPVSGLLAIPDAADASPAERQFNRYLRTLDGYPLQATASAAFSAPLDPASVTADGVRVLDITAPDAVQPVAGATFTLDETSTTLRVSAPWQPGRRYAIALVGGPVGLKGSAGQPVVGAPALLLVRASRSLVTCEELAAPDCRPTTALIGGASPEERAQKAVALERFRRLLQPVVRYLAAQGTPAVNLAGLWAFSTASMPLATFDPANRIIPFPNELLMQDGKVNLPPDPADDAQAVALKAQLNELDGFSTTASLRTESGKATGAASARLDAATVREGQFLLVSLAPPHEEVPLTVTCRACADGTAAPGAEPDQVVLTPRLPLRSHTRYAAFWLKGARAPGGGPLANTSSTFALLRLRAPLVVDGAPTVRTLTADQATQLEPLRERTQPLLAVTDAREIPREDVLLAWSFTTQTTTQRTAELARKPGQWGLSTALVGAVSPVDLAVLAQASQLTGVDWHSKVRAAFEGQLLTGLALAPGTEVEPVSGQTLPTDGSFTPATLASPRTEPLRFIVFLPKTPKFADGRIPVLLFQHGLNRSRRDAALIANTVAGQGYATLAIDAPFHGVRSYCRGNSACASGGCVNHRCPGGYAATPNDPTGTPAISGQGFISSTNPFATRDHFRQHVIDLAQVLRSLEDTTAGIGSLNVDDAATSAVVERLEPASPRYIGQSLGGIIGGVALGVIPELSAATLNVAGGDPTSIVLNADLFQTQKQQLDAYLAGRGIPTGSQAYFEFLDTARWVIDPADPQNFGRHLIAEPLVNPATGAPGPKKRVFISWVYGDQVVPNANTQLLLRSIALGDTPSFFKQTQYSGGDHSFLLNLFGRQATQAAQAEAVNWSTQ